MKNTILFFLSLLFGCSFSFAQEGASTDNSRSIRLKLGTELTTGFEGVLSIQHAPVIPAIQLRTRKGNLHQLEILHLGGNLKIASAPIQELGPSWAIRYEYARPLLAEEAGSWMPYLGLGLMNAQNIWILDNSVSWGARPTYSVNLTEISLVPSAQFQLGEILFIDFALPLTVFSFERNKEISVSQGNNVFDRQIETTRDRDFNFFSKMGLRFGLGVKL
ncbi:MAG: hypothetical protein AAF696_03530 [Bacteroidota bacterium]